MTLDPDQVEADDEARTYLTRLAGMAAHYYEALSLAGLPDVVKNQLVCDWHSEVIGDGGVDWEPDDE